MYSKYKGITDQNYSLTPPPGYDGSRFRRRSDGRDDAFPLYREEAKKHPPLKKKPDFFEEEIQKPCPIEAEEECDCRFCEEGNLPEEKPKSDSGILSFLQGLGNEELLLIALILILANDSKAGIDTILILALLLCIS